jgi:hypothetical protein
MKELYRFRQFLAEGVIKENIDFPELEDEFEGAMDAMVVEPEVYLKDILNASADEIVSDDYYEIMNAVEQGVYSKDEAVKLAKSWAKEKLSTLAEGKLLKENAPGYSTRKTGEALPTLESVKAAYEAKDNIKEYLEPSELEDLGYRHGEKYFNYINPSLYNQPYFEHYLSGFAKGLKDNSEASRDYTDSIDMEDEAKNDIKEDNSSDYEVIVSLLGKLADLAERNIENSENFDLEDMSQVIGGYYDEMKELGGFEKYDDEMFESKEKLNEELYDFVKDIKYAVGSNASLNNIEYYLGRDINDEERGALINAGVLRQVSDGRYGSQYKKIQRRRY